MDKTSEHWTIVLNRMPGDYFLALQVCLAYSLLFALFIRDHHERLTVGISFFVSLAAACILYYEIIPRVQYWEMTETGLFKCAKEFGKDHPAKRKILFSWEQIEKTKPRSLGYNLNYNVKFYLRKSSLFRRSVIIPVNIDRYGQLIDFLKQRGLL